ncbi:3'-5' exonuclease [Lentisphaerota bacterium WC36G]|nr:3'-5' exonuclease [Lentisphaerae bacterium WC36]
MLIEKWHELGPFTIFDVETTGFSPVQNRIIEIAAVRIELDGTQSYFSSLVNPSMTIPYKITQITKISNMMIKDAPIFADVGNKFTDFARGTTLVAHNARFDLAFLQESLARTGLQPWQGKTLDSLTLAKQTFQNLPSYKLQDLRILLNLKHKDENNAHRALDDAKLTTSLVEKIFTALLEREK